MSFDRIELTEILEVLSRIEHNVKEDGERLDEVCMEVIGDLSMIQNLAHDLRVRLDRRRLVGDRRAGDNGNRHRRQTDSIEIDVHRWRGRNGRGRY